MYCMHAYINECLANQTEKGVSDVQNVISNEHVVRCGY